MFQYLLIAAAGYAGYKLFVEKKDEKPQGAAWDQSKDLSSIPTFGMPIDSPAYRAFVELVQHGTVDQLTAASKWWDTQPGGAPVAAFLRNVASQKALKGMV